MTRHSMLLVIAAFSAASAIAAVAPKQHETPRANVTVIEKNQAFPQVGPLIFEDCLETDCGTARD